MSAMKLNIMLERSSLDEETRELIREAKGDLIEINGEFFNKWEYLEMHQLEPMTQHDPQNQKDVNLRLNTVMANESL